MNPTSCPPDLKTSRGYQRWCGDFHILGMSLWRHPYDKPPWRSSVWIWWSKPASKGQNKGQTLDFQTKWSRTYDVKPTAAALIPCMCKSDDSVLTGLSQQHLFCSPVKLKILWSSWDEKRDGSQRENDETSFAFETHRRIWSGFSKRKSDLLLQLNYYRNIAILAQ